MEDGVSLRSMAHPRPPLWRRVWFYLWRPTIKESALVTDVVELPEPSTLVAKLRYIGSMQTGDSFPSWMTDDHNHWGEAMSKLCNEAADELERLGVFEEFWLLTRKKP